MEKDTKGVWWRKEGESYMFADGANGLDFHPLGPELQHFCSSTLPNVYRRSFADWHTILESKTVLPVPCIRVYDCDGNPTGRMLSFSSGDSDQPSSMEDTTCLYPQHG